MESVKTVEIEITQGCTSYSYCINGVEWVDLTDKESERYDPGLVNAVTAQLLDEFEEQYPGIPRFLIYNLYEVESGNPDIDFDQDIFASLVKHNKNTIEESLGTCEECGDSVYRWGLAIEVPMYNLD